MIWLILMVGLSLRLISLNQSLWLDETISVLATQNFSFLGMITEYAKADFHPPGYFIILWLWTKAFGIGEIAVRVPSIIFGVLTVYVVYLIGRKLHSKSLGLFSALLLAVNPLHIYYSQEARMYTLAALAVTLNVFLFIKLLKNEKINFPLLFFGNFFVLALDYLSYLIFLAQFSFLILKGQIKYFRIWFGALVAPLLVGIFWLPIFLIQLGVGVSTSSQIPTWKTVVGAFELKSYFLTYVKFIIGRISHPNDLVYASLFLPAGLLFFFLIWRTLIYAIKFNRDLLLAWVIVPILAASFISLFIPVYSYFRLLYVLPGFLLLISLGIFSFRLKFRYIFVGLVVIVEIISSSIYLFNPTFHREDWRGLTSFLKTIPKDGQILVESSGAFTPLIYYGKGRIELTPALKKFPARNLDDLVDSTTFIAPSIYLIDYLVEISDPKRLVRKSLMDLGYKEADIKNFNGVGFVYHFVKNE